MVDDVCGKSILYRLMELAGFRSIQLLVAAIVLNNWTDLKATFNLIGKEGPNIKLRCYSLKTGLTGQNAIWHIKLSRVGLATC